MAHSAKKILSAIFFVIVFTGRLALHFYNIHLNILTQTQCSKQDQSTKTEKFILTNFFQKDTLPSKIL